MQSTARASLVSLVEEHLTGLVRDAIAVQRHCKRARYHEEESSVRRRLHAADINMALVMRGSTKLYGTPVAVPEEGTTDKKVDLEEFLRRQTEISPPTEVALHMHWLAVDGEQPEIPENPFAESLKKHTRDAILPSQQQRMEEAGGDSFSVQRLQAAMLSQELQLYYTRVTTAMERGSATPANARQQDAVILSVSRDPGLQELVPFFVRYCTQELYRQVGNSEHCRALVRLALALLQNTYLHLELHLHELLPALLTCVVAKRLSSAHSNHWALRREAAVAVVKACNQFGTDYVTLKARVLRTLCDAIGPDKTLPSRYGGMVAITMFGPKAIDAFLLPMILAAWEEWEHDKGDQWGILMCQQAALVALASFLRRVDLEEKANRIEWQDMEEVLGDRLIPIHGYQSEYALSFV